MGKLDLNKISLSAGITAVALFVICYVLFMGAPTIMMGVGARMFHGIQMMNNFSASFSGFVLGLLYSFIVGLVIGAVYAWSYNMISKK